MATSSPALKFIRNEIVHDRRRLCCLVSGTCFADIGNQVICVDKNLDKINKLKSGICPIYEPGLSELIKKNYLAKRLFFSSDVKKAINSSDIIFICVGTPTKKGSLMLIFHMFLKVVKKF